MSLFTISINVLSLLKRIDEIRLLACKHKPCVIAVQETWLTELVPDTSVRITGYGILRHDRANQSGYAGTCTYVRNDICWNEIQMDNDPTHESIWIPLNIDNQKFTIINIYRPPAMNFTPFVKFMESAIVNVHKFITVGDLNISSRSSKLFNSFLNRNDLKQWVNGATYLSGITCLRRMFVLRIGPE